MEGAELTRTRRQTRTVTLTLTLTLTLTQALTLTRYILESACIGDVLRYLESSAPWDATA